MDEARFGRSEADHPALRRVAIVLFDEVEVLDFAGPFEVFGVARTPFQTAVFEVITVALEPKLVTARNGLRVLPHTTFTALGRVDVLVVPGGMGSRAEMVREAMLEAIRASSDAAAVTLSVCTGALILAAAGRLRGLSATTHYGALDLLRRLDCGEVLPDARVVDNGRVVTSAGISAGIDAALHLVGRLIDADTAERTARYMQYDWTLRDVVVVGSSQKA